MPIRQGLTSDYKTRNYASQKREILLRKLSDVIRAGKSVSMGKLLRESGYSFSTSRKPKIVIGSLNFQDGLEEILPGEYLLKKHRQLLEKKETIIAGRGKSKHLVRTSEIDPNAVAKGLEMAYKLKGRFDPEKSENKIKIVNVGKWIVQECDHYDHNDNERLGSKVLNSN